MRKYPLTNVSNHYPALGQLTSRILTRPSCIIDAMTAAPRTTEERPLTQPHEDRLSPDDPQYNEILRRHATAMDEGKAGYLDPATGLLVITATAHLQRGKCCTNGCRHCPYV